MLVNHSARTSATTELLMEQARMLPAPPPIVGYLLEVMGNPNCSIGGVGALIRTDAWLSARLLAIANAAASQRDGSSVPTVDQAIQVLGDNVMWRVLVGAAAACLQVSELPGYGLQNGGVWQQSLRCAIAAEEIATRSGLACPTQSYAAGLVLDIGKLVLGSVLEPQLDRVLSYCETNQCTFDVAERQILGIDHAEIGANIAELWELPPPLIAAIRYHHSPERSARHYDIVCVAHIASTVATMLGSNSADGLCYEVCDKAWRHINLSDADLHSIMLRSTTGANDVASLLHGTDT